MSVKAKQFDNTILGPKQFNKPVLNVNIAYLQSCIEVLRLYPDNSIDLIAADPPFNIGFEYSSYNDNREYNEYLEWCYTWMSDSFRVLKSNGTMWVFIGDEYLGEYIVMMKVLGFHLMQKIVWYYTFGTNCKRKFARCHTNLLWFVKDKKNYTFNDTAIRVQSTRQKMGDKRANPIGKIPDSVWQFSRIAGTFKRRIKGHNCQIPIEITDRIVKVSSNEGDIVFELFGGTMPFAYSAKNLNRKYITCEIDENYYQLGLGRLWEQ